MPEPVTLSGFRITRLQAAAGADIAPRSGKTSRGRVRGKTSPQRVCARAMTGRREHYATAERRAKHPSSTLISDRARG